ncbi:MAG: peptide ABC transporter substrate-binding protein [Hyphomonadaceae bacterium]
MASCAPPVIGLDAERGILDIGNSYEPFTLDPHKAVSNWESNVISGMFVGLVAEDPRGRAIPGMALSWETSEDGLAWRFHLREANWSDGRPVTAHDFEFSFRRILDPETIAEYAALLYVIENAQAAKSGETPVENIGVRALDARTLEIRLAYPAPYLPSLLRHNTAYPVPRHVIARVGDDWVKPRHIAVNGPFKLVKWWSNALIRISKNPAFFDAPNVALNDLYYYPTGDSAVTARRVRAGELAWSISFPANQLEQLEREMPDYVRVAPQMMVRYLPMNRRRAPFDDARVREALSLVVDRAFIARAIFRTGEQPAARFIPFGVDNYPDERIQDFIGAPIEARRARARRLLEQAGYGPERPLEFEMTHATGEDSPRLAVVIQSDARGIAPWVRVRLRPLEGQIYYATLRAHDFQIASATWLADFNDARNFLYLFDSRTGAQNYSGHQSSAYDDLLDASDRELNRDRRAALMREAERMAMATFPVIPLTFGASRNLVHPRLAGYADNVEDIHRARWFRIRP